MAGGLLLGAVVPSLQVHHTDLYDHSAQLVLRRGQLFSLVLQLATPPSGTSFVTRATFAIMGDNSRRPYSFEVATVSRVVGQMLSVDLKTPADVPVGR